MNKKPVVPPEEYVDALVDRAKKMDDAALGKFVRKTLWTATNKAKRDEN